VDRHVEVRGSAINYLGNPRFCPRCAFKVAATSQEMEQNYQYLLRHAIVVMDDGSLAVRSREEVKDIIQLHFGIRKHEFSVIYSHPEPFTIVFHDSHFRDVLFTAGVPHHAWNLTTIEIFLCDEATILHVEKDTQRKIDQHTFDCWVVAKDPSRIPQTVFLSLTKHDPRLGSEAQNQLLKPRGTIRTHVFKILVHVDAVEDLMFYHYPKAELVEDGKRPWRDFKWKFGKADGDLDEDDLHPPPPLIVALVQSLLVGIPRMMKTKTLIRGDLRLEVSLIEWLVVWTTEGEVEKEEDKPIEVAGSKGNPPKAKPGDVEMGHLHKAGM
jgi:hypothetical protein